VEVPFATVVAGVVVRGRMDAVFAVPGQPGHYDVIDWKTGKKPTGADATAAAVQLAAYRIAWAELAGVPVDQVGAGFHLRAPAGDRPPGRPARRRRAGGAGPRTSDKEGSLLNGFRRGRDLLNTRRYQVDPAQYGAGVLEWSPWPKQATATSSSACFAR
jgi:RecB family exonuclease